MAAEYENHAEFLRYKPTFKSKVSVQENIRISCHVFTDIELQIEVRKMQSEQRIIGNESGVSTPPLQGGVVVKYCYTYLLLEGGQMITKNGLGGSSRFITFQTENSVRNPFEGNWTNWGLCTKRKKCRKEIRRGLKGSHVNTRIR